MDIYQAIDINIQDRIDALPGGIWQAEPDFYRIALELSYLDKLEGEGWWGDGLGGCLFAENLLRHFGNIVGIAAGACEARLQWDRGTIDLLDAVMSYLRWAQGMHGEVPDRLFQTALNDLDELSVWLGIAADEAEDAA